MRIDVEALNLDFFDDFVQLAGKRVQQASGKSEAKRS